MSEAIHSASLQPSLVPASRDLNGPALEEGVFRGQRVNAVSDERLALQDAAEEVTTLHGERTSKDIAKRKSTDRSSRSAELAARFLQRVPDIGQASKFHQLAESLKRQAANCTARQLSQLLREELSKWNSRQAPISSNANRSDDSTKQNSTFTSHPDPTDISHQYVALEYLDELLAGEGDQADLLSEVRQLRTELDATRGPEIRAGLNIARLGSRFDHLDGPQNLRDFYRETVLAFDDLAIAQQKILQRYGESHFELATEFLIHAVGEDFSAEGPSIDPRKLKATIDNLYVVQVARNIHNQLDELLARLQKSFGIRTSASAAEILSELLPLKDQRWVDATKIQTLASRLGLSAPEANIYFLQGLAQLVSSLPERVFASMEDRDRLRRAIQSAVDQAIDQEGL